MLKDTDKVSLVDEDKIMDAISQLRSQGLTTDEIQESLGYIDEPLVNSLITEVIDIEETSKGRS
ncbi:hypothetical protein [Ectobacillus panaciterrae]|uniref:hypothetical protein n=1 Tax=Ectobacillus panaciterrae TaxID=363872 RepID=UPI000490C15B|nr:hypothetical protein [Ectobacillus panaciterrae]